MSELAGVVDRVKKVAKYAFSDAIDYSAAIYLLETGNTPEIDASIKKAGAERTSKLIQNALFERVWIAVMTSFDPIRGDDYHMRLAIDLLDRREVLDAVSERGNRNQLSKAVDLFTHLDKSEEHEALRHYRNKEVVHFSELDPKIQRPLISQLISFAHKTGAAAEALANGAGIVALSLGSQLPPHTKSAEAFWQRWRG